MAAAAKLVAVRSAPRTTTTQHHRAAASATTPVTTVSLISNNLQHNNTKQAAAVVAAEKLVVPTTAGRHRADAASPTWQEVHGAGDWHGLVDPLHPVLRAEVVRYGELVAACYRAFDLDPRSKRYLNCKHGKAQMLEAVGLAGAGYAVTRYIYAAAPDVPVTGFFSRAEPGRRNSKSRWIGYVAVASDAEAARLGRRDVLVSFRGTVTGSEWLANFMSVLTPARFDPADPRPDVRVESGFLSLYTSDDAAAAAAGNRFTPGSCRNQLLSEVARLIGTYKHEDVSVTLAGHSMGSSLALLLGYDLAELGLNRTPRDGRAVPVTVFSFAGPRVGNLAFRDRCDELGVKVLRVVNVNDPVTKMPGFVFNEKNAATALAERCNWPWSKACYAHVGVEVALDFLKAGDIACVHDLEAYIDHLLNCGTNDITIPRQELVREGHEEHRGVSSRVASLFNSWRWQMAAIRAGELMQVLGI